MAKKETPECGPNLHLAAGLFFIFSSGNQMEQSRCRESANSSSFSRSVYSEIEEVGWEHLVRLSEDLKFLSFHVM
ncbi:hypothetical protein AB3S75_001830 [Citrus x aurantiifolia]